MAEQRVGIRELKSKPRQFLSLARPDDALFVDFNSLFEAVFIRGE